MTKIICLNGPIECGKDTIGTLLAKRIGSRAIIEKFAQPIRDAAIATFPQVTEENFEKQKSQGLTASSDTTLREWMIAFSEELMKPKFGDRILGQLLIERFQPSVFEDFIIITDSGFLPEAETLAEEFGPENIALFRITREGTGWRGDSRGWIEFSYPIGCGDWIRNEEGRVSRAVEDILYCLGKVGWVT